MDSTKNLFIATLIIGAMVLYLAYDKYNEKKQRKINAASNVFF